MASLNFSCARSGNGCRHARSYPSSPRLNRDDRKAAMKFAFKNAGVDCVTVGYKNTAEIDEAIENLNLALT